MWAKYRSLWKNPGIEVEVWLLVIPSQGGEDLGPGHEPVPGEIKGPE